MSIPTKSDIHGRIVPDVEALKSEALALANETQEIAAKKVAMASDFATQKLNGSISQIEFDNLVGDLDNMEAIAEKMAIRVPNLPSPEKELKKGMNALRRDLADNKKKIAESTKKLNELGISV